MISLTQGQKMKKIKLITFDLDDTFWDINPVIISAERSTREFLEGYIGKQEWGSMSDFLTFRKKLIETDSSFEWNIKGLRRAIYQKKILEAGYSQDNSEELVDKCYKFFLKKRHEVTFYKNVFEAIEELSTSYSLGVLTNGNADINHFGIGKYFDFSISSYDVKSNKPEKGHFIAAKKKYNNLKYDEIIHIGDHPINDVKGALDLGINAIWFNGLNKNWEEKDIKEPLQFNDWTKLTKLIKNNYE